ncbi:NCS2 family permease [Carnobacterium mobile]|uniref:NCS2 family permease n=1 Tax=Carnobacterium mobile TaxID=2750 RepID=UPI0018692D8F|nr:NCS2 family permease [Carnobacterium mobile]
MLEKLFKLKENRTNIKTEIVAGITTFMTMAYVLVVQPGAIVGFGPEQVLTDINGVVISKSALLVMTALISGLVTLLMAFYANLPFALSTGMGTNFMLGALLQNGDLSFGNIMMIVLISGIIFVLLSVLGIRDFIVRAIPANIKTSISVAIGFFIAYLGFKNAGIGNFQEGISMGDFTQPPVFLAIFGLILIAILTVYHVPGALLIGIIVITILGIPLGVTQMPSSLFAVPDLDSIQNISFTFDFKNLLNASTMVLIFITFCGDFFSTLGTVLGVAQKANLLDESGNYPEIQRPFIVDAIGTCVGALTGCTTVTTFVESSAGVEAGGRTGLSSFTSAIMFFLAILAAPLFLMIPDAATGPALIFVGYSMISSIGNIDFTNFIQAFGPFIMIVFTIFTGSIATGISAGILADITVKTVAPTTEGEKVHPAMYALGIPLVLYFTLN